MLRSPTWTSLKVLEGTRRQIEPCQYHALNHGTMELVSISHLYWKPLELSWVVMMAQVKGDNEQIEFLGRKREIKRGYKHKWRGIPHLIWRTTVQNHPSWWCHLGHHHHHQRGAASRFCEPAWSPMSRREKSQRKCWMHKKSIHEITQETWEETDHIIRKGILSARDLRRLPVVLIWYRTLWKGSQQKAVRVKATLNFIHGENGCIGLQLSNDIESKVWDPFH